MKASFQGCGANTKMPHLVRHLIMITLRGGGGIRTPGALPHNSFQDCRHRPLGHTSKIPMRMTLRVWDCKFSQKH